jgi:hypothetical protein
LHELKFFPSEFLDFFKGFFLDFLDHFESIFIQIKILSALDFIKRVFKILNRRVIAAKSHDRLILVLCIILLVDVTAWLTACFMLGIAWRGVNWFLRSDLGILWDELI